MPGRTKRGANTRARVTRQRRHDFNPSKAELEDANKTDLISKAEELGVLDQVPRSGETDTPLKEDLVSFLYELSGTELR